MLALCGLLAGCYAPRQCMVVNNTHYPLDVYRNGVLVSRKLQPGDVVSFPTGFLAPYTMLAIARDANGNLMGTDAWVFYEGGFQSWRVTYLEKPQP